VFAGIVLAVLYRKEGPQMPVKVWEEEGEEEEGVRAGRGEGEKT